MVKWAGAWSSGYDRRLAFESHRRILDGSFSHLFLVVKLNCCLEIPKEDIYENGEMVFD